MVTFIISTLAISFLNLKLEIMLRKTTITFEILDNPKEGYNPSEMSMEQLVYATIHGNMSGHRAEEKTEMLTIEQSVAECHKQGSDPDFFGLSEDITEEKIREFLKEWGTEVYEMPEADLELKMDDHRCIEFEGKQYFVAENNSFYSQDDESILSFLEDNYHV